MEAKQYVNWTIFGATIGAFLSFAVYLPSAVAITSTNVNPWGFAFFDALIFLIGALACSYYFIIFEEQLFSQKPYKLLIFTFGLVAPFIMIVLFFIITVSGFCKNLFSRFGRIGD